MSTTAGVIVRARDEGERRWFYGGGEHLWKATTEETNGAFLLFEDRMTEGKVTPLHIHPESDESMMVLEGEILVHIDGTEHRVGAGGFALAARGVPHAFLVTSPEVRLLCLHTPGCCQRFYLGASDPLTAENAGTVDMGRVQASAEQYGGIEILGPPPFAAHPDGI
ncbi:cupin domain-containing protein [Rhodococcus sp. 1168]|uniref:cupin domain-containing protein n=1 Tax=Rhodococcus sp. 1168 TaxID=2018041 RepID=UPI000A0E3845|nr:cupin domain-containing protein [Rhodococcus sp. 1168]ORI22613.1 cupin [Rhodococcus sp. 1168]